MASETHLLILRPRSAVTACGKHLLAIYPHTATAQPAGLEEHINYTILLQR
jgi:predicted RNase H-like nuclease